MNRSVIVAAAVGLAVLAGCGNTPEPSPPPTSEDALTTATTDATEETEAAPTTEAPETEEPEADGPPEMPAEAEEQTEAGAEAYVEHYVEVFNYAYAEGDPSALAPLNGEGCKSCEALTGLVSAPSEETAYLTLKDVTGVLLGDTARVEAPITQAATTSSPEQSGTAIFELRAGADGWEIAEITVQNDAS